MITFKEFITESYQFKKVPGYGRYSFTVDGKEMIVEINHDEVTFYYGGSGMSKFDPTGYNKNQFKIINTVVEIIQHHVDRDRDFKTLWFTGNGKRAGIYEKLVRKFNKNREWEVTIKDHGYGKTFKVERK